MECTCKKDAQGRFRMVWGGCLACGEGWLSRNSRTASSSPNPFLLLLMVWLLIIWRGWREVSNPTSHECCFAHILPNPSSAVVSAVVCMLLGTAYSGLRDPPPRAPRLRRCWLRQRRKGPSGLISYLCPLSGISVCVCCFGKHLPKAPV